MTAKQMLTTAGLLAALAGCATSQAAQSPGEVRACEVLLNANPTAARVFVGEERQLKMDTVLGDPLLVCAAEEGEMGRDGSWWAIFPDKASLLRLVNSEPGSPVALPPGAVEAADGVGDD